MFSQSSFVGFVATDPEIKKTTSNRSFCKFNLAVDRPIRSAAEKSVADFHHIEVWDGYADFIAATVHKGDKLFVAARPQNRTYPDKNGVNHTSTFFTASHIEFAGNKKERTMMPPPLDLTGLSIEESEVEGEMIRDEESPHI